MKKKIAFLTMLVLALPCLLFAGCRKMDHYLSVVPTDREYKAVLHYSLETSSGGFESDWLVIRKTAFVAGQDRAVIYVEYGHDYDPDEDPETYDLSRTLIFVSGKVFSLNGDHWEAYAGSFGDKWSDIYGAYNKPDSFVYLLTNGVNYRSFPTDLKKETANYLEYDFGRDNEVFRISNDPYHLILYYTFDYDTTHTRQNATITYGTPADTIPCLTTITQEMLED